MKPSPFEDEFHSVIITICLAGV